MVRTMLGKDLPKVTALCSELHQRTRYRKLKPHWPTVTATLTYLAGRRDGFVRVAEHDNEITGIIACTVEPLWWMHPTQGGMIASDLMFFSKRRGDGHVMAKQATDWAWSVPRVVEVLVGVSSGIRTDKINSFYGSLGLEYIGPMYSVMHPKLAEVSS